MANDRVFKHKVGNIESLYVEKVEREVRTKDELDQVLGRLTGYDHSALQHRIDQDCELQSFCAEAPVI